jgi:hypothetical protein
MAEQPNKPSAASVEADLFGSLFGFYEKMIALLRESSLDDERRKIVADRIKTLIDAMIAEMQQKQQLNLTEQLEAACGDVKGLVDQLSGPSDGGKRG